MILERYSYFHEAKTFNNLCRSRRLNVSNHLKEDSRIMQRILLTEPANGCGIDCGIK